MPNRTVLLDTCELLLWVRWLVHARPLWNRLLPEPQGNLLQRAFEVSCQLASAALADRQAGLRSTVDGAGPAGGLAGPPPDSVCGPGYGTRRWGALAGDQHGSGRFKRCQACRERLGTADSWQPLLPHGRWGCQPVPGRAVLGGGYQLVAAVGVVSTRPALPHPRLHRGERVWPPGRSTSNISICLHQQRPAAKFPGADVQETTPSSGGKSWRVKPF